MYADDLTMWTCTGSAGEQQDALQEAIDRTEHYLHRCGLSCAPEKSELLILKKRTRGRPPQETPDPTLTLNGVNIPKVDTLCILGLTLQKDGAGLAAIKNCKRQLPKSRTWCEE